VKSLFRITVSLLAVFAFTALVPAAAQAKKRYHLGDRVLKVGKRGADVRALQKYLGRAGSPATVDGVFGRGTKKAVKVFERAQMRRADGKVSRSDARALKDVVRNGGAIMASARTGGAMPSMQEIKAAEDAPLKLTAGQKAKLGSDGLAIAPASAPAAVKLAIAAGNRIAKKPYIYGGGHGKWEDAGYDCSGSVSYALHAGGLLKASMPSGSFMNWGKAGAGTWITLYANGGHIFAVIAGLRFDTSGKSATGSRWQKAMRSSSGYSVRHPKGY
jgi:peptidoglycan hydrolase-like protein with peptidoglycan-binding domain